MDAHRRLLTAAAHRGGTSPGGGRRSGLVRRDGRCVYDDGGNFHPLGLTYMWNLQGYKHEFDHYDENMAWASAKRFDFVRPLTEVAWSGTRLLDPTTPEWADWHDVFRACLDRAYDTYGLRFGVTISGKGTSTDRRWLAREIGAMIADGRAHKTLCVEMQNEYWNQGDSLDTLIAMFNEIRPLVPNLLSLSAPENTEAGIAAVRDAAKRAGADIFNRHTERNGGDYGWRDWRQSYDFVNDGPFIGADWEGPGPGSSGAQMTSPLHLACKRLLAAMCGAPIFILHTGTGVYGDGKPSSNGFPRPANFWEIENIDAIVDAVRGVDVFMPPDLANWNGSNSAGWAFQPHAMWEGTSGEGANKAFTSTAPDGRFLQLPGGIRGHVTLTANYSMRDVTISDPLTRLPVLGIERRSFSQGESVDLPGGGQDAMVAYVIQGRRA